MSDYTTLRYGRLENLQHDFLRGRKDFLGQGVEQAKMFIELRKEVMRENKEAIAEEKESIERRLRHLGMNYTSERVALLGILGRLESELRTEKSRLVGDVARMSRDLFKILEEYREMKELTEGDGREL